MILDPAEIVFAQANLDHERAKVIEDTLAAFGAPAHVVEIHRGPTVTQFGVEPDFVESRGQKMRVRVSKIVALADDIALALAAPRIRIQAPVPGRNYVGIEVPNTEITPGDPARGDGKRILPENLALRSSLRSARMSPASRYPMILPRCRTC